MLNTVALHLCYLCMHLLCEMHAADSCPPDLLRQGDPLGGKHRTEKTTPFGVDIMRSQELYWAARKGVHTRHSEQTEEDGTCCTMVPAYMLQ